MYELVRGMYVVAPTPESSWRWLEADQAVKKWVRP
jgi:hypothetical protein